MGVEDAKREGRVMPREKPPSGAVVVPTLSAIDKSVLATEAPHGVSASDICVKMAPSFPLVVLEYRMDPIIVLGSSCLVFLWVWCFAFINPWVVFSVDDTTEPLKLSFYNNVLTFVRAFFPPILSAGVGYVFTVVFVNDELTTIPSRKTRGVVKKVIATFFCLPLAGIFIQPQPRPVTPLISSEDLGKHTSLLIDASTPSSGLTSGVNESVRASTTDTMLRRLIVPPHNRLRDCNIHEDQKGNAYTSVAYEFMASDWQATLLPKGIDPTETYTVPSTSSTSNQTNMTISQAALFESLFTRAVYLYADAVQTQAADLGGTHAAQLAQLKLDAIAHYNASAITITNTNTTTSNSSAQHVNDYLRLGDARHSTGEHDLAPRASGRERGFGEQNTTWPGTGDVVYEIDVSNECGATTCGIQNRGLAPDPKVVAYAVCPSDGSDCDSFTSSTSMWLFGFGRRIEGEAFELQGLPVNTSSKLRKVVVRNPREFHRVTIGFFAFKLEYLDRTFNAACLDTDEKCIGVSLNLHSIDPTTQTPQYLIVGRANTPMQEFGSGFDLANNLARGRPLATRFTTGARVEYEILRPANFDSFKWTTLANTSCSGKMERGIITTELNHIYMENPLQVTHTAGLFFLFHNARLVAKLPGDGSLDILGNHRQIDYGLTVPSWQILFGLVEGGVMVLYGTVMLVKYNKQLSTWSIGQLQEPGKLLRALGDSAQFPAWFVRLQMFDSQAAQPMELHEIPIKLIEFESSKKRLVVHQPAQPNNETFDGYLKRVKAEAVGSRTTKRP